MKEVCYEVEDAMYRIDVLYLSLGIIDGPWARSGDRDRASHSAGKRPHIDTLLYRVHPRIYNQSRDLGPLFLLTSRKWGIHTTSSMLAESFFGDEGKGEESDVVAAWIPCHVHRTEV